MPLLEDEPDRRPKESANGAVSRNHLLLTVLGVLGKNPRRARYVLDGREFAAELAPVALLDLLPESKRPHRVLALCTPEAERSSWPLLERALHGRVQTRCVPVEGGDGQNQVNAYLESVARAVPPDVEITVDVTHGFRHFSFLTYIAVLYLQALRSVRVRGAYYGMLNQDGGPSPFLDLRPLLELPDWLYALRVLRDTGSVLPIVEPLRRAGPLNQSIRRIEKDLSQFSEAYLSGLPMELGQKAFGILQQHKRQLRKRLKHDHSLPLADELITSLKSILEPFSLADVAPGDGWKKRVVLTEPELKRQARVIDKLLQNRNLAVALGLMNEWTVSWVSLRLGLENWLDYERVRRKAGALLGAIRAIERDSELRDRLTERQQEIGDFWHQLNDLRNGYAHHGMRPQILVGSGQVEKKIECIKDYWNGTLRFCPDFSLSLGQASGRILVSPIGMRPGVLFSALHACWAKEEVGEPTLCLVICSSETEGKIAEVKEHASYAGEIEPLLLEDPYGGPGEIERMVEAVRGRFIGADQVVVNVTGGTTLMGLAAEALANEACRLACPVRRFGLIDRRSPKEQGKDPYRAGEAFWLDSGEDADAC